MGPLLLVVEAMKIFDPVIDTVLDNFFAALVARAPRRPAVPECQRIQLSFARMRQRWKRKEPTPKTTKEFARVLQLNGVYIFEIAQGYLECEAAQGKIAKALGR